MDDSRQKRAEQLLEKCREILRREGIPASENIADIKINDRIRSRFGSCRKEQTAGRTGGTGRKTSAVGRNQADRKNPAGRKNQAGRKNPAAGTGSGKEVFHIEISGRMMTCENDKDIETVLLHELLHTCPRCMNHGVRWKRYAEHLNEKYGYRIRSSSKYTDFGLKDPGSKESVKYHIVCTGCGLEMTRRRRCRLVENVDRYRCGKCGAKLEIR